MADALAEIEAVVREGEADIEPVIVLAFAFDNRVDAVRRCGWLLSFRHLYSPS